MRSAIKRFSVEKGLLVAMPLVLIGGAWLIGKTTVDHLLYHDAVMTGQGWATYLAENVHDLDRIVAGEKPSPESQRLFERAQKVGQVFRYVIYDLEGRVRLASNDKDDDDDDTKDADARNLSALKAIATALPVVHAEETDEDELKIRPPFFAETYLPVSTGGKVVGVVETYVDQTEKRDAYRQTLVVTSAALVGLVGLAFGIPTLAWLRRSREKRLADARIQFLAHHDPLTGLINRTQLAETVAAISAERSGQPMAFALHYIDVDRFKDVNDTLGHEAGDTLIKAIAARLRGMAGPHDCIARIGGDEFVVVQAEWACERGATAYAEAIVRALDRPFDLSGHEVTVTASVGVALAPAHGETITRLMKSADLALYRSKDKGRNRMSLFSADMDDELAERLRIERALRAAVEHDRFELYFQPAVEMPARRLVGFEALIRMRDEAGASIAPTAFIPIAERMGLIVQIGTWVLREACRQAAAWPAELKVAVNLSPPQLTAGNLASLVAEVLEETGLPASRLELEITEGMLLDNSEAVLGELRRLKALGVGIVMDDFGTGYSSLSYLWKFPFDKIKIDRAFMLALDNDPEREASTIVKTIIGLGRSLDVTVTVEGVETDHQVDFVNEARGDQIQGYYFGRPLPAIDLPGHILRSLGQQEIAAIATAAKTRKAGRTQMPRDQTALV